MSLDRPKLADGHNDDPGGADFLCVAADLLPVLVSICVVVDSLGLDEYRGDASVVQEA